MGAYKNNIFGNKYGSEYLLGLVGYYPLNSNGNDLSGKGYNGTVVGTPTYSTGKVSNAIDFGNNTNSNYIDIPDNSDFSFTNGTNDVPFSVSMWINITAVSSTGNWFINKRNTTSGGDEWQIMLSGSRFRINKFQYNSNASFQDIYSNVNPFLLNTWYHICVTDAGTANINDCKLYINGVLSVSGRATTGTYTRMNNGTSITRIGVSAWGFSNTLKHKGLIDELAIWKNRELTATEVLGLYTKGSSGLPII